MNAIRGWLLLLVSAIVMIWLHGLDELNVRVIAPWMDWLQGKIFMFYPALYYLHADRLWTVSAVVAFAIFILLSVITTIIWPWHTISQKAGKRLSKESKNRLSKARRENVARGING